VNAQMIVEDVAAMLARRFGPCKQLGKARILTFGSALTCSINYSKLLGGHKYFYAVPQPMLDPRTVFPETKLGEFVILICGSVDRVLVLPRQLVVGMMKGVSTRRVDVFLDSGSYILQTTKHPKCNVTEYLNAFPAEVTEHVPADTGPEQGPERLHVKIQWSLIALGRAEGCSVWVPVNDRNLSYKRQPFAGQTLPRLPHLGLDENSRQIVQNIDVLWLTKNAIQKAIEIEATTSVYSGLLRLNDLVLAQPNVRIDLYVAAPGTRRRKVENQLMRQTFQPLIPKCRFLSFEDIDDQMHKLDGISFDSGARVSGLIQGERFTLPEHYAYPSDLS
jgi:hypothetical protein